MTLSFLHYYKTRITRQKDIFTEMYIKSKLEKITITNNGKGLIGIDFNRYWPWPN